MDAARQSKPIANVGSERSRENARTPQQDVVENRGNLSAQQPEEMQMTILEAAVQVLRDRNQPMKVAEIYESILEKGLYTFGAKSPRSVLSGTLRNHIKKSPSPELIETSPGIYGLRETPAT